MKDRIERANRELLFVFLNSVVIDVRPTPMPKFVRQAKCVNGKRAICVTKYETMCVNKEVTHEMMEDHPRSVYLKICKVS